MREYVAAFLILLMVTTAIQQCTRTLLRPVRPVLYRETTQQ